MHRPSIYIGIVVLLISRSIVASQDLEVPVELQFSLLTKILSYDRNIHSRSGNEVVLGIIYQSKYRTSLDVHDDLMKTISESTIREIEGIPLRAVSIDLSIEPDLESDLRSRGVNLVYIAPLRAVDLNAIKTLCRSKQVVTVASVPEYVEAGLAIGFGLKGEKPEIMINLPAAKAEGADFNSQLLKLARVLL